MELQKLHSSIQEHQSNICQISVLQNGNELYSSEWNGYQKTDCVHIASATKSVMALLIGIAIDHKMIGSVNDIIVAGAKSKGCRSYGVCAAVALAMMLVGAMGMKIVPAEYFGVVERFSVFAATGFNAALGIHLFCMKPKEIEE